MAKIPRPLALAVTAIALTAPLASCSRAFEIEYSGFGPNIRVEFHDDGLFRSSPHPTCLKDFVVYELVDPAGVQDIAWHIRTSGDCVTLTGMVIGHVPTGFIEVSSQLPLKIGSRYQAVARAEQDYPDKGLSSRWFVCRGAPEDAEWESEHELRKVPASCTGK